MIDLTQRDDDDNNQIVRPMMPMVPKLPSDIEPEKSDIHRICTKIYIT
jgi:hypothetical protein